MGASIWVRFLSDSTYFRTFAALVIHVDRPASATPQLFAGLQRDFCNYGSPDGRAWGQPVAMEWPQQCAAAARLCLLYQERNHICRGERGRCLLILRPPPRAVFVSFVWGAYFFREPIKDYNISLAGAHTVIGHLTPFADRLCPPRPDSDGGWDGGHRLCIRIQIIISNSYQGAARWRP